MTKKERYAGVINWFDLNMPTVDTELHYDNPFHLLIAVILSAQCTDKRVNIVTPPLFAAYPTPEVMAVTSTDAIYEYIKSVSYPNNKAKNLLGMAKKLVTDFEGQVPQTLEELESIPGVGRKTANVMLIVAFNKPAMPVDTHVFRVSSRLGLTDNSKNPAQTEKELIKYIPSKYLSKAHHWLILHGRYVCIARRPKCEECGLTPYCKFFSKKK
ncbi:MAG: endonuclease III [Dysgonomonas sp.]